MAILYMNGFDYDFAGNSYGSIAWYDAGRDGGRSAVLDNFTISYSPRTAIRIGFAFYILNSSYPYIKNFAVRSGGTNLVQVFIPNSTTIQLSYGSATLNYITPYRMFMVWSHLVLEVDHSTTSGAIRMYLNGGQIFNITGANTGSNSDNIIINSRLGPESMAVDDLWITDSENLGDVRIIEILPSGDVAAAWSRYPSSLTANYEAVDDAAPGHNADSDYIYTSTAGATDVFSFQDLSAVYPAAAYVRGVGLRYVVRKDEAGSRTVRGLLRIGGTDYYGSSAAVPDSYAWFSDYWATNPATSSGWTVADVDGLQAGLQLVS